MLQAFILPYHKRDAINMKNISEQYRREAVSKDKSLALWRLDAL